MRITASPSSLGFFLFTAALAINGCTADGRDLFTEGDVIAGGGSGGTGSVASSGSASSSVSASSSSSASSSASSTASSSSSASSSASSGTGGAGTCAHELCSTGEPLTLGCDSCVDQVCAQDQSCCENFWGGNCVSLADQLCNKGCCGDGVCDGETCDSCQADCGMCFCGDGACNADENCTSCQQDCGPCADCPHSVCVTGAALNTTLCRDSCVDEVCAPNELPQCCVDMGGAAPWNAECANKADMLCGGDPCIMSVCATNPSCCTNGWTQACVDAAKTACNVACDCAHDVCAGGNALAATCSPCAQAVCASDPYCCESNWDGICVNEAASICGIKCN